MGYNYFIFSEKPEKILLIEKKKKYLVGEKLEVDCNVINTFPQPIIHFRINNKTIQVKTKNINKVSFLFSLINKI